MFAFRWIEWNIEHIARHGVSPVEAEYVVNHAAAPYPESAGDGRLLVRGRSVAGRYLQVVYVIDTDDEADVVFVIHARPLTDSEKRRLRRRRK